MRTAALSLILACCGQAGEPQQAPVEPRSWRLSFAVAADGDKPRLISATLPPGVGMQGGRLDVEKMIVDRENFDRWLFGSEKPVDPGPKLRSKLDSKLELTALEHGLTGEEKERLRLAGIGDIKRFLDRVEQGRRDFEQARQSFRTGVATLRELTPLCRAYKDGPFGEHSLFAKTLGKIERDRARPTPLLDPQ